MNEELLGLIYFVTFIVGIVLFICQFQSFFMFKENHPKAYKEMGSPSMFGKMFENDTSLMKFYYKREYVKLNDKKLKLLCGFYLIMQITFLVLMLIIIYMFIDSF